MKTCSKCGITKERSEFYLKRDTSDGLSGHCKACVRSIANKRWETKRINKQAKMSDFEGVKDEFMNWNNDAIYC